MCRPAEWILHFRHLRSAVFGHHTGVISFIFLYETYKELLMWLSWWEEGKEVLTRFSLGLIRYFHKYLAAVQDRRKKKKREKRMWFDVWLSQMCWHRVKTRWKQTTKVRPQIRTFGVKVVSGYSREADSPPRLEHRSAAPVLSAEQSPFLQSYIQRFIEDILLGVVQNEPCPQSSSNFTLAE